MGTGLLLTVVVGGLSAPARRTASAPAGGFPLNSHVFIPYPATCLLGPLLTIGIMLRRYTLKSNVPPAAVGLPECSRNSVYAMKSASWSGRCLAGSMKRGCFEYSFLEVKMRVLYSAVGDPNTISKAVMIENPRGTIVLRKKGDPATIKHPRVVVFIRASFTSEECSNIYTGRTCMRVCPSEREAIELLRNYLKWVDGYEIIGKTLHVKTVSGKRIPVYDLSDGQRVVVFISLLYAISKPPVLLLIDTPEAFIHPDGVPTVADFIARFVAEGNQVVTATQSMEFVEELLVKAKEHGILSNAGVQRITLTKDGRVKVKGRWGGDVSLRSIKELGADLRR